MDSLLNHLRTRLVLPSGGFPQYLTCQGEVCINHPLTALRYAGVHVKHARPKVRGWLDTAYDDYHKLITQILGWQLSWLEHGYSGWHLSRLRMLISVEQVSRCFSWKTHKTAFASNGREMPKLENHQRVVELKILPSRVGRDQKRRHANCKWFAYQTVLSKLFLLSTKLRHEWTLLSWRQGQAADLVALALCSWRDAGHLGGNNCFWFKNVQVI